MDLSSLSDQEVDACLATVAIEDVWGIGHKYAHFLSTHGILTAKDLKYADEKQPSSWTVVLDQQRIRSDQTSVEVAATQLRQLAPLLGCRPIVASDRWYSCASFLLVTEGLPFDKVLRLKRKRVLYRAAPAPTGKRGAPRKDGERFQCGNPSTSGEADGRAAMPKAIPSRAPGGQACICPRRGTSK
jgi:DDE superfamily endonuclease